MPKKNSIEISIILSAFKRPDLLPRALAAIAAQDFPAAKFELIVVDDAALPENQKVVDSFKKKIKNLVFLSPGHKGAAKARMSAFAVARGAIFAFTDEDTIPAPDWLSEIKKAFDENPSASGIEGRVTTDEIKPLLSNAPQNEHGGIYIGCNTHYRAAVVNDAASYAGYFPEFYFWREDTSMAFKALKKGPIVFAPRVVMHHPAKAIPAKSIVNNLRFLKDDWVLFRRFPRETVNFLGKEWVKYLGFSLFTYLIFGFGLKMAKSYPPFLLVPLLVYFGVRAALSLRGKAFSFREGCDFLAYSLVRDLLYPLAWVGYGVIVLLLNDPAKGEYRVSQ